MNERPFREPAISQGYPLDKREDEQVRGVARSRVYHVTQEGKGWQVKRDGALRRSFRAETKQGAIDRAAQLASRAGGGEVVIHGRDGRIRERNTVRPR